MDTERSGKAALWALVAVMLGISVAPVGAGAAEAPAPGTGGCVSVMPDARVCAPVEPEAAVVEFPPLPGGPLVLGGMLIGGVLAWRRYRWSPSARPGVSRRPLWDGAARRHARGIPPGRGRRGSG